MAADDGGAVRCSLLFVPIPAVPPVPGLDGKITGWNGTPWYPYANPALGLTPLPALLEGSASVRTQALGLGLGLGLGLVGASR